MSRNRELMLLMALCLVCLMVPLWHPIPAPTGDTCVDYCEVVERCAPVRADETCLDACTDLLVHSGDAVRCWAQATDCTQARACDE